MLSDFNVLDYATEDYSVGDIVQIRPEEELVGGCLMVLNGSQENHLTGIIAVPNTEPREGQEWAVRVDKCVKVGTAEWVPFDADESFLAAQFGVPYDAAQHGEDDGSHS